jgi:hypothetical protein
VVALPGPAVVVAEERRGRMEWVQMAVALVLTREARVGATAVAAMVGQLSAAVLAEPGVTIT